MEEHTKNKRTKSPTNKFAKHLEGNPNQWFLLSDLQDSLNKKGGEIYLTSDIETLYYCLDFFKRFDSNKGTYLAVGEPKREPEEESKETKIVGIQQNTQLSLFTL